jgi:TolB protein
MGRVFNVNSDFHQHPHFRIYPTKRRGWGHPKWIVTALAIICVVIISWMALNYKGLVRTDEATQTPLFTPVAQASSSTPSPSASPNAAVTLPVVEVLQTPSSQQTNSSGVLLYAARSGGYSHLWLYRPGEIAPVQITNGNWDDRDPALSPQGKELAFSSRRGGNWDLYLLDINTGEVRRLTATLGHEGQPSWSPDGQWLAYSAYYEGNFDIWLLPVNGGSEPIRLTSNPAIEHSPKWSPDGRRIIFVSNRDGNFDLFLADLDKVEDRFSNLTHTPNASECNPDFSSDGSRVAFCSKEDGVNWIMVMDLQDVNKPLMKIGQGSFPSWSGDDQGIAAIQTLAYQSNLVDYSVAGANIPPLGISVTGMMTGLDWTLDDHAMRGSLAMGGAVPSDMLYEPVISEPQVQAGRLSLIPLKNVSAPRPVLSDAVDEAFDALRDRVSEEVGWDFLANLDNAFVGINDAMPPGFAYNDWLYTGRAIAISEMIVRAGWVKVFREDIYGDTYWRLFVRTRFQDGSQGQPLTDYPWDFQPRFGGDANAYDRGGSYQETIPEGYYVDFTSIAADYGFLRQAALPNWRTYYAGARYTEFAMVDGLSWEEAMLQLYPAFAIQTPTPFCTPTSTPTRTPRPTITPWWLKWQTPTSTPTPTSIATVTSMP